MFSPAVVTAANPGMILWLINLVRPIQDYAKSSLEVAEYEMRKPNGDLFLAKDYLERVAGSNAEDVGRASELLKSVKIAIQAKVQAEAEAEAATKDALAESLVKEDASGEGTTIE